MKVHYRKYRIIKGSWLRMVCGHWVAWYNREQYARRKKDVTCKNCLRVIGVKK